MVLHLEDFNAFKPAVMACVTLVLIEHVSFVFSCLFFVPSDTRLINGVVCFWWKCFGGTLFHIQEKGF